MEVLKKLVFYESISTDYGICFDVFGGLDILAVFLMLLTAVAVVFFSHIR